jgi:hypothetical protein
MSDLRALGGSTEKKMTYAKSRRSIDDGPSGI